MQTRFHRANFCGGYSHARINSTVVPPTHIAPHRRCQSFFLFTRRLSLSYAQECTTTRKKHCAKHRRRIFCHVYGDDSDNTLVLFQRVNQHFRTGVLFFFSFFRLECGRPKNFAPSHRLAHTHAGCTSGVHDGFIYIYIYTHSHPRAHKRVEIIFTPGEIP